MNARLLEKLAADPAFWYSRVYATPCYPWQVEMATAMEAFVDDARNGRLERSEEIVGIAARQSGKNETLARFIARILMKNRRRGGSGVLTGPSWTPTLGISKDRLKTVTQRPIFAGDRPSNHAFQWEDGRHLRCGQAKVTLVSAEPTANKDGHTASLFLAVDESQDVCGAAYQRNFRPMLSTSGAPTFLFGSAWSNDTLLEQKRQQARERQKKIGRKLLWEVPWWVVSETNAAYGKHVEGEKALIGEDHPIFASQYCLRAIDSGGRLFDERTLTKMRGDHQRYFEPREGRYYVAGVDLCGSAEQDLQFAMAEHGADVNLKRDSTVVTVAEMVYEWLPAAGRRVPVLRIVDHLSMQGTHPLAAADEIYDYLFRRWQVLYAVVDASGVGDAVAAILHARRPNQVTALKSTVSIVSDLGYNLIAAALNRRLLMYRNDDSADYHEFWMQAKECRRELRAHSNQMRFSAPPTKVVARTGMRVDCHDDFIKSASYCVEAAARHLSMHVDPDVARGRNAEPYWHGGTSIQEDY